MPLRGPRLRPQTSTTIGEVLVCFANQAHTDVVLQLGGDEEGKGVRGYGTGQKWGKLYVSQNQMLALSS